MSNRRWNPSLLALAIFTLLATALLHRALLPGYTLLPLDLIQDIAPWDHLDLGPLANPLISDPLYIYYPNRYLLTTALAEGRLPLWNPYILSGTPTTADPNFQPFYLPNLIAALFLPVKHALPWLAWAQLILTGWLMYGFLGQHRPRWAARVLGGGIWMLNGYIVVWLENPHRLSTLTWLPAVFWAYQKAVDERRLDYAALGGLLLGLSILGGQVQFIFAVGLVMGVYALSRIAWDGYKDRARWLRWLAPLVIMGLIGLGAGAAMLLPASEFAAYSQRVRYTPDTILGTRWPWQHLVTLIAPDFYGNPVNPEGYWGLPPNYAELAAYFGVVALLLALTAPFVARRRAFAFAAGVCLVFVLAIVLGAPLMRLLFLFPGAEFLALRRLLFLLPLCGAWLAAIGLDGWLEAPARRRWIVAPILAGLGLLTALILWRQGTSPEVRPAVYAELARSGLLLLLATGLLLILSRRPRLAGGLLVLLALFDLWQWGRDFNPITSTRYLFPENGVVDYLSEDTSPYRVLPLQSERLIFGPNVLSLFRVEEIGGYSSLIRGDYFKLYKAISDRVDFFWLRSGPNKLAMSVFEPEVSLLNVKYILSARELPVQDVAQVEQAGCETAAPLGDGWTAQPFTATAPGLNRLDFWFAPNPPPVSEAGLSGPESAILFRLWRDELDGQLVAEQEIQPSELVAPTPHTVYFAPVADSAGQRFVWGIRGGDGMALCASGPDRLPAFIAYGTEMIFRAEVDGVWIYENPNALPRAYLVHHAESVSQDRLLDRLLDGEFDYYHSVLLTGGLGGQQLGQLAAQPVRPQGEVEISHYGLHRVDLKVQADRPGIVVLADASYPGWRATVNGAEQPILEINSVYRGVFVPSGTLAVTFDFRPGSLYWGLGLTLFSLLLAAAIALFTHRRRRATVGRPETPEPKTAPPAPQRSTS
jgi:hypothetical protein